MSFFNDFGECGHLIINDLKINIPLHKTDNEKEWQKIVDETNSALIIPCTKNGFVVIDHAYQGFDKIKKCKIGTFAKIETNNFIKPFLYQKFK